MSETRRQVEKNLVRVVSPKARKVGESFMITQDTRWPSAMAVVVRVLATGTGFILICKLLGY
jgi:hypothetical protein